MLSVTAAPLLSYTTSEQIYHFYTLAVQYRVSHSFAYLIKTPPQPPFDCCIPLRLQIDSPHSLEQVRPWRLMERPRESPDHQRNSRYDCISTVFGHLSQSCPPRHYAFFCCQTQPPPTALLPLPLPLPQRPRPSCPGCSQRSPSIDSLRPSFRFSCRPELHARLRGLPLAPPTRPHRTLPPLPHPTPHLQPLANAKRAP